MVGISLPQLARRKHLVRSKFVFWMIRFPPSVNSVGGGLMFCKKQFWKLFHLMALGVSRGIESGDTIDDTTTSDNKLMHSGA